jgi:Lung seven transmembrane receptor
MCCFYFALAFVWSVSSALHWNSLLRIQFWVGAVILLGMLEKACFYFEYHQANEYGISSLSLALIAELVSCVKRTLSRILVLIVSIGFGAKFDSFMLHLKFNFVQLLSGITKSRLGDEANVSKIEESFIQNYFCETL